ncbi:MAG: circularly permuted type 2 ATP-grasp protein [Bryobacteraceae bacterium]|nr:circularly permuted type 2 ATP-grasp protein [Bryobacteraceae bacterium]MDW8377583.1 circularly permuted type 2 ATP-grasp protein [Bryobacterales bacterium]
MTDERLEQPQRVWGYRGIPGHYDEVLQESGLPRRPWRRIVALVNRMGLEQFGRRWEQGRQLIQNNGITYNVYGDPQGKDRPWPLDPIPLVISPKEWAGIEAAIVQRATLLNLILADLYGPQRLLKELRLPPELVYHNPLFHRACYGVPVPEGVYLHSYAADIARSPDGQWWVLADRTQTPSGAGYALENRMVSAQIFPEAFRQAHVRMLTRYFQCHRDGLLSLVQTRRDNPRVVLLTPGPYNETFFEHAYLARYLGYTLVEGADLTVRDDRVFLKTLGGLAPVDLILRRQDDAFCDPLELRGDSLLGVPGLLQAVRTGHVVVANALGSGVLETPAHLGFLPGLARQMIGEELKMPSVATWWCGQEEPRRYVRDHLNELVIKPAFPKLGSDPVFADSLSRQARQDLLAEIEQRPWAYVAQERVALSTAPVWTGQQLAPRHVVLRVFAAWSNGSYVVMPGGLTRISTSADSLVVSMQRGGGSKDTWVLTTEDEEPSQLIQPSRQLVDVSRTADLPSRVADNLFWLGRYTERLESITRIGRSLLPALSGEGDLGNSVSTEAGLRILAGLGYLPLEMVQVSPTEQRHWLEKTLLALVFDPNRTTGLGWNVTQVKRIAWQLKERLSADTWRILSRLDEEFPQLPTTGSSQRLLLPHSLLDGAILRLSAFAGLAMENMTRGHGWRFLDIGRRIERALQMISLLRYGLGAAGGEEEAQSLDTLLQIADSSITYRSRYYTLLQAGLVLDLLLSDEANPRSVAFQLATLSDHIAKLPAQEAGLRHSPEAKLVLKALTAVRLAHAGDLVQAGENGEREALARFLEEMKHDLETLSHTLTNRYLSHAVSSQLVASA